MLNKLAQSVVLFSLVAFLSGRTAAQQAKTPAAVELKGHTGGVSALAFSPDAKFLVSGSSDGTVRVWDVAGGTTLQTFKVLQDARPNQVVFSGDGKLVAACSSSGVQLWDVKTGEMRAPKEQPLGWTEGISFSPDGKWLATGHLRFDDSPRVLLWDLATLQPKPLTGHAHTVMAVAFSPDGKLLASLDENGKVNVWDVASGEVKKTLDSGARHKKDQLQNDLCLAFSPNSKLMACSGEHTKAKVFNLATGELVGQYARHQQNVSGLDIAPDGETVASADFEVVLWDAATGKVKARFANSFGGRIEEIDISSNGKLLAWADTGTAVYLNPLKGVDAKPHTPPVTASDEPKPRFWTDATGRFRIKATLIEVRGEKVKLKREDGREITVPINRLSRRDQEFIRRQDK